MELPNSLIEGSIKRGDILHSTIFEEIDHGKFFAVIGISDGMVAGFFFINSRIHPTLQSKPEQFAMQYLLRKSDYDFLRYDSFLCATVLLKIPVSKLAESIVSRQTSLVSKLTDVDLNSVLEACRQSKLFSKKEKIQFFY